MAAQLFDLSVTVGGIPITGLVRVGCQHSVSARIGSATIVTTNQPPDLLNAADTVVTVTTTSGSAVRFRGDYVQTTSSLAPNGQQQWTITATGILKRLTRPWNHPNGPRIYNYLLTDFERQDNSVIQNICEAYGIPASRLQIFASFWQDSGGATVYWLLGLRQDVVLEIGTPGINVIDQINEPPGFAIYDQPQGYIQRARYRDDYAELTAIDTVLTQGDVGIETVERIGRDISGIVNRWTVRGLPYRNLHIEATAEQANALLNSFYPPQMWDAYEGRELQANLLEELVFVQTCAALKVQDTSHAKDGYRITLAGHPYMLESELQRTIGVNQARLGNAATSHHRIIDVADDFTLGSGWNWKQTLVTNGGTLV